MRISIRKSIVTSSCLLVMFALGFLLGGFIASSPVSLVPPVEAQANKGPGARKCSSHTLKGAYGIKFEGQKLGTGPFVSISLITFDGEGNFTTNEIGRFNGEPVKRTFMGPYSVNEDCTGFLDFSSFLSNPPHEAHGDFIIVDGGKEFYVVDNEEGWAANGVGKRL
ncbi:MAG TPA: hypothetical protein VFR80_00980 [Pyrinomonadaceae bacterium]|nr:hypothetical protein [Pyrinomonadaceae bacterium]